MKMPHKAFIKSLETLEIMKLRKNKYYAKNFEKV